MLRFAGKHDNLKNNIPVLRLWSLGFVPLLMTATNLHCAMVIFYLTAVINGGVSGGVN